MLDTAIEDAWTTSDVDPGSDDDDDDDLIVDYLALLFEGLEMHDEMTRGTPMETFHTSLMSRLREKFPATSRAKAELAFKARCRGKGEVGLSSLLGVTFGTRLMGMTDDDDGEVPPVSSCADRDRDRDRGVGVVSSTSVPPQTTRLGSFSPLSSSETLGTHGRRSDTTVVSPGESTRSPSVVSMRIPMGVKRLRSLLGKARQRQDGGGREEGG